MKVRSLITALAIMGLSLVVPTQAHAAAPVQAPAVVAVKSATAMQTSMSRVASRKFVMELQTSMKSKYPLYVAAGRDGKGERYLLKRGETRAWVGSVYFPARCHGYVGVKAVRRKPYGRWISTAQPGIAWSIKARAANKGCGTK